MRTSAEGGAKGRIALVVATGSYTDPTLGSLRAPGQDASDFAAVLGDQEVGGFQVETVLNAPVESLRRHIARFCARGGPGDLALVYLSCHGVLDDRGRLYYAAVDTDRELLSATAVSAAWLNEQLDDCRCRRQILVLDCCHSGAFAKGAKGAGTLALGERFEGRGRVVLTGSRATEYSFERNDIVGESVSSVFTDALVQGLRSGDADRDRDGAITVSELYDYAYEVVRERDTRQTPTLWTYGAEGDLLIAHSPLGAVVEPTPLPEDLIVLLESARPRVREGAVAELADLLKGPDAGRALMARSQLEKVAAEDVASVAGAARAALDDEPAPPLPRPARPPAPTPARPPRHAGRPMPSRRMTATVAGAAFAATVTAIVLVTVSGTSNPHWKPDAHPVNAASSRRTTNNDPGKTPPKPNASGAHAPAKTARLASSTGSASSKHSDTSSPTALESWPRNFDGYTVALASDVIEADAVGAVHTARSAGMQQVGFVWSSDYRSLTPGYWFVFSGAYTSATLAQIHVAEAVRAGFHDAYVRHVIE